MSTKDMLICVEQIINKGIYYLIFYYHYCNQKGKNHGYNVTAYAQTAVTLSNISSQINVNSIMQKAVVGCCKKNKTVKKVKWT